MRECSPLTLEITKRKRKCRNCINYIDKNTVCGIEWVLEENRFAQRGFARKKNSYCIKCSEKIINDKIDLLKKEIDNNLELLKIFPGVRFYRGMPLKRSGV